MFVINCNYVWLIIINSTCASDFQLSCFNTPVVYLLLNTYYFLHETLPQHTINTMTSLTTNNIAIRASAQQMNEADWAHDTTCTKASKIQASSFVSSILDEVREAVGIIRDTVLYYIEDLCGITVSVSLPRKWHFPSKPIGSYSHRNIIFWRLSERAWFHILVSCSTIPRY